MNACRALPTYIGSDRLACGQLFLFTPPTPASQPNAPVAVDGALSQRAAGVGLHVGGRYWLMPPEDLAKLAEFPFDFDPCPFPKTFDGLACDWGQWNFVNPPFRRADGEGVGPTAFVRKALEQQKLGRSSVLVLPTQSYGNLLLEAGAELRSMGRIRWLEVDTKQPMPGPSPITAFILRGLP